VTPATSVAKGPLTCDNTGPDGDLM